MVTEDIFRPKQIRLHESKLKQNIKDSEEYSEEFLLYSRKEREERMPEIFLKTKHIRKPNSQTNLNQPKAGHNAMYRLTGLF